MKYLVPVVAVFSIVTFAYAQTSDESKSELECEKVVNAYVEGLETGEAAGGDSEKLALSKDEINALKKKLSACELKSEIMRKNHNTQ
jgi:hypothetical protein